MFTGVYHHEATEVHHTVHSFKLDTLRDTVIVYGPLGAIQYNEPLFKCLLLQVCPVLNVPMDCLSPTIAWQTLAHHIRNHSQLVALCKKLFAHILFVVVYCCLKNVELFGELSGADGTEVAELLSKPRSL
ncbi:hypothetical protein IscW_ISCW005744 [Ixodes scapularis]|uniref:Uncharacterized protein n=1 Tax=Ixodes scapularis TaxID=6945 RepID=B7PLM4_IXOSC|nr:hypothetical protein IscW_ISCW005744 [Ixodes scapularis]|eukprot:XP_002434672.1 hypothetical protein IscW_ISCW005744 [Ixodes scapularis]